MNEVKQGELYKKIKACRTHAYVSSENFDVTAVVYVRAVKKDYLIKILNEVNREFPKYPNIADYPKGGDDWLKALDKYDHEVEDWKKKWFGDLNE